MFAWEAFITDYPQYAEIEEVWETAVWSPTGGATFNIPVSPELSQSGGLIDIFKPGTQMPWYATAIPPLAGLWAGAQITQAKAGLEVQKQVVYDMPVIGPIVETAAGLGSLLPIVLIMFLMNRNKRR